MADTSTFMAVGQMPQVDYGAVYEQAKARREAEQQRKLDYLNQFQKERGAFTEGMQSALQEEWDAIESDLDSGDMSFEAKARRQRMYNNYKQHAADALEYATKVNDLEASILADPQAYNDPGSILEDLRTARQVEVGVDNIPLAMQEIPSLNEFRRYSLEEMAPNVAAGGILNELKAGGGISNFYDMAKSGQLDPNAVSESVSAYFGANALSQEQEDQAIAYVMHQLGAISSDMSDISKVRNLSEDQRKEYLGQFAQYVTKSLTNLIADDIETAAEEDARKVRNAQRLTQIKSERAGKKGTVGGYQWQPGTLSLPTIAAGRNVTTDSVPMMDADLYGHVEIPGAPSYTDMESGVKYQVHSIGLDNAGNPVAIVGRSQSLMNPETNKSESRTGFEMINIGELPLDQITDQKKALGIYNAYEEMMDMYGDIAGSDMAGVSETTEGGMDADLSRRMQEKTEALRGLSPIGPGIPQSQTALVRPEMANPESQFRDMDVEQWESMSFNDKSNYVIEKVKEKFSNQVVGNERLGTMVTEYSTLTPRQRQAEIKKMEEALLRELGVEK